MRRNGWLALLVGLNLTLLGALAVVGYMPRAARAQGTGLSGNFMVVSGEIQTKFDALYLIDLRQRMIHTFYYEKGGNELQYAGNRSLEADFRNQQPENRR